MSHQKNKKPPGFLEYVLQLNGDDNLSTALQKSLHHVDELDVAQLNRIGQQVYEEGKWTIHQILQHLIDWERIWCNHAVIYARNVQNYSPGPIDQDEMANGSNANELTVEQLIDELKILRQSSILMFKSFNQSILEKNCEFSVYQMPLYTIGLTITAHQIHHFNIIRDRYLPLDK